MSVLACLARERPNRSLLAHTPRLVETLARTLERCGFAVERSRVDTNELRRATLDALASLAGEPGLRTTLCRSPGLVAALAAVVDTELAGEDADVHAVQLAMRALRQCALEAENRVFLVVRPAVSRALVSVLTRARRASTRALAAGTLVSMLRWEPARTLLARGPEIVRALWRNVEEERGPASVQRLVVLALRSLMLRAPARRALEGVDADWGAVVARWAQRGEEERRQGEAGDGGRSGGADDADVRRMCRQLARLLWTDRTMRRELRRRGVGKAGLE